MGIARTLGPKGLGGTGRVGGVQASQLVDRSHLRLQVAEGLWGMEDVAIINLSNY